MQHISTNNPMHHFSIELKDTNEVFYGHIIKTTKKCKPDDWNVQYSLDNDINEKWFLSAVKRSFKDDENDKFYAECQERDEGLYDVTYIHDNSNYLIVLDKNKKFFGCIQFLHDVDFLTRVMYLYVGGYRRRYFQEKNITNYMRSAQIIWTMCALVSQQQFGKSARIMIVMPRMTIIGSLIKRIGGTLVLLDRDRNCPLIKTPISKKIPTLEESENYVLHDYEKYQRGIIFDSAKLISLARNTCIIICVIISKVHNNACTNACIIC